ncbi:MAG TPA: hypothetical protein VIM11_24550 [Tepidisphaeraceae bacterium]|jgi:hypothetical protein
MSPQRDFRRLMEQIRHAHAAFSKGWTEARTAALKSISPMEGAASWEQVWQANGIAYQSAQSLADRRDRLLGKLFEEHLIPLQEDFLRGVPSAVDAVIDFLEVDVPAFRCGYAKEYYLRQLKKIRLSDEQQERIRQYGLRLCSMPVHRREIGEAGRLMIRFANRAFVEQLRGLTTSENDRIREKSLKMLSVIQNGRNDLR